MSWLSEAWNTVTAPVEAGTQGLFNIGTNLGNALSGNWGGSAVTGIGDLISGVWNTPTRIGTAIGNAVNAPGRRNPLGMLERPLGSEAFGQTSNFFLNTLPWKGMSDAAQATRDRNVGEYWTNVFSSGSSFVPGAAGVRGVTTAGLRSTAPRLVGDVASDAVIIGGFNTLASAAPQTPTPAPVTSAAVPTTVRPIRETFRPADETRPGAAYGQPAKPRRFGTADTMERQVTGMSPEQAAQQRVSGVSGPSAQALEEYANMLRQVQSEYDTAMSNLRTERERALEQARLEKQAAAQSAVGGGANLRNLLASMGLDTSPASYDVGLQGVAARGKRRQVAAEAAARGVTQDVAARESQAETARKRAVSELNRWLRSTQAQGAMNLPGV